jgi:hypothetical protein
VWAVAAYVGCMELLTWMRENLGMQSRQTSAVARTASASASVSTDAPDDELRDRRERKARQPVAELLALAEQAFPGG